MRIEIRMNEVGKNGAPSDRFSIYTSNTPFDEP